MTRGTQTSCVVQHLKLVLENFDINEPGLPLDEYTVDSSTVRTERSAVLGDFRAAVTRIEDPDNRAVFRRLDLILSRHCQM